MGQELSFWFKASGQVAAKRVIGFRLLCAMPEEGIEEVIKTMKEVYEFYSYPLGIVQLPEKGRAVGTGAFTVITERPDFGFEE
jgi:hypothetical protein